MAGKKIIKLLLRVIVTAALLLWVFKQIDILQFRHTLKLARWDFLLAIWVTTITAYYINSIKMRLILKKQSCDVSVARLFGASAITSLYSMFMPGPLSAGVKWYILKKYTSKGSNVFGAMAYNQFTEITAIIVLGLIAIIISNPAAIFSTDVNNTRLLGTACIVILIIIFSGVFFLTSHTAVKIIRGLEFLLKFLPEKICNKTKEILQRIAVFKSVGCRFHFLIAIITIIACLISTFLIYTFSAGAANINIPLSVFFWLPAIIFLLGKVPISIANLGVREVTLAGFLSAYGVPTSSALLMSMIIFSADILMAAIGAVLQTAQAINLKKNALSSK